MKLIKKVWLGAALSAGLLASGAASAGNICVGCAYNSFPDYTGAAVTSALTNTAYLGVHNPTTSDQSFFGHSGIGATPFTDWWVFSVNPAGLGSVGASFTANSGNVVNGFTVALYSLTGITGGDCSANTLTTAGSCNLSGGSATLLNSFTSANSQFVAASVLNQPVSGFYAFRVSGTISGSNTLQQGYSGNLNTNPAPIPEPASLALVALGLLAAGGALRRRA